MPIGLVSQEIWHLRKLGTPIPNILGYFAPPMEILYPSNVWNFNTPVENILGSLAPLLKQTII